jgi:hypothetical protein
LGALSCRQHHSTVRVLPHIEKLDYCFGQFLVRVICDCGGCREIEAEALERLVSCSVTQICAKKSAEVCGREAVARWAVGTACGWFTRAKRNPGSTASTADFHKVAGNLGNDGRKAQMDAGSAALLVAARPSPQRSKRWATRQDRDPQ